MAMRTDGEVESMSNWELLKVPWESGALSGNPDLHSVLQKQSHRILWAEINHIVRCGGIYVGYSSVGKFVEKLNKVSEYFYTASIHRVNL